MEIPRNESDLYILISVELMKVEMGEWLQNKSRAPIDAFLTSAMADIDKIAEKFSKKLAKQLKAPKQTSLPLESEPKNEEGGR